ncbi:MAG: hypothetical protein KC910_24880, partial [Candidatus Eremiobacteraeota bacterium]|nr:hypothetical protein [Candidatus Eremiobacteraeota bacterium]
VSPVDTCSGHPGIDLDPLARRAGWVLSRLAFQNFGAWDKQQDPLAAARAREWWAAQAPSWQRLDGLEAALKGHGLTYRALDFLHDGAYWGEFCEGLTRRAYFDRILPLIVKLQQSEDLDIRKRARGLPMVEYPRCELSLNGVTPANSEQEVAAAGAEWQWHPFNPHISGQLLYLDGQCIATLGDPVERVTAHLGLGKDGVYAVWPFELYVEDEKGVITKLTLFQPYVPWYDH